MVRAYQREFHRPGGWELEAYAGYHNHVQVTGGSPRSMSLTRVKTKTWLVESAHCRWWRCKTEYFVDV